MSYASEDRIGRYSKIHEVVTSLDPMSEYISWISSLRSIEYTSSLLRDVYLMQAKKSIQETSKEIKIHIDAAISLFDQAMAGPEKYSYLPLYYSFLNLAKIIALANGKHSKLKQQKYHGVSYKPTKKPKSLLSDKIGLRKDGTIPLFFEAITGKPWMPNRINFKDINIKDLYSSIGCIACEYEQISGKKSVLSPVKMTYVPYRKDRMKIRLEHASLDRDKPAKFSQRSCLTFARRISKKSISNRVCWETASMKIAQGDEKKELLKYFKSYLFQDFLDSGDRFSYVPLTTCKNLFPQEVTILLAFFHLGSVVRYSPDFMEKIYDSHSWTLIDSFRRHGAFAFLKDFWSSVKQESIQISVR